MSAMKHDITAEPYGVHEVGALVRTLPTLGVAEHLRERIALGHGFVARKAEEGAHLYGVNTGFGALCETVVSPFELEALQRNLILSHSCGVGELADEATCRMTMLLKFLTFRTGNTGVSLAVVDRLLAFWNAGVIPAAPSKGSLGASGDLAPLAHMALPLLGLGQVYMEGRVVDAEQALSLHGWEPLVLGPKEGLALINGVQYITAVAACSLIRAEQLTIASEVIAALGVQAFCASRTFFHELYHSLTGHAERRQVARHLASLLAGSNHWELPHANRSMQDPYSFRCIPQISAAIRQALKYVHSTVEAEINTVGDNPLFFPAEDEVLFGGNLHGASTALALDCAAIACAELASASERRMYQLLSGQRGLPDFLAPKSGLNSGFMVAQYTAAALVNENKVLATPSSVDTIMTSQLQEDHVSMGGTGASKLMAILANCEMVLAIELLIAAQAAELQEGLVLSGPASKLLEELRAETPFMEEDRILASDFVRVKTFLAQKVPAWLARAQGLGVGVLEARQVRGDACG